MQPDNQVSRVSIHGGKHMLATARRSFLLTRFVFLLLSLILLAPPNAAVAPPPPVAAAVAAQHHAIREVHIPNTYPMTNIEYPGPHDVVLGRGRGASSHIGNVNFRGFIKQYKPKYAAANRVDKPKVAGEVVVKWREKVSYR